MSVLFLAKGPLDEVAKEKDVEIEWMPFELRPSPYSKIDPWNEPEKLGSWDAFILPTAKKLELICACHVFHHIHIHI